MCVVEFIQLHPIVYWYQGIENVANTCKCSYDGCGLKMFLFNIHGNYRHIWSKSWRKRFVATAKYNVTIIILF